jgi:hypothetical protein
MFVKKRETQLFDRSKTNKQKKPKKRENIKKKSLKNEHN